MARIPFDLPNEDIARLAAIALLESKSRAEVLRDAVAQYRAMQEERQ